MSVQDQIDSTELDMTEAQVKAFFLGILCAEKPLPFHKALIELLSETPEAKEKLEASFQSIWTDLTKNLKNELAQMFPIENDIHTFLEISKDQLDFFLTGMSLSGSNIESCKDEDLSTLIEELEDAVEDLDDFLSDSEASSEEGEDFKEYLLETWKNFVSSKQ